MYYVSRKDKILQLFETHSHAWRPFLYRAYGEILSEEIIDGSRKILINLILEMPYIGGDDNPMTRHIIRASTCLALYKYMAVVGKSAQEVGDILYQAVKESVSHLPPDTPLSEDQLELMKVQARISREKKYQGDWVWDFIEGDGVEFVYGYDFYECGVQKFFREQGGDAILPYFCTLDFVTYRTTGWSFFRSMTLAEGYPKCDFRFRIGGDTIHKGQV